MTTTHMIEAFLSRHQVPFELVSHRHSATSLETAHAARLVPGRVAKAVLLEGDGCVLAAMVPSDRDVRLSQLKQDFGDHIHLADEATIRGMFPDCEAGAMPGLPEAWGVETIWEDELLEQPDIYLEAGDHQTLVHVETRHLKAALSGIARCHFGGPRKVH